MREGKKFSMLNDHELRLVVEYWHEEMTTRRMDLNEHPNDHGTAALLFKAAFWWETATEELVGRKADMEARTKKR
jgi:hypothetical protein